MQEQKYLESVNTQGEGTAVVSRRLDSVRRNFAVKVKSDAPSRFQQMPESSVSKQMMKN